MNNQNPNYTPKQKRMIEELSDKMGTSIQASMVYDMFFTTKFPKFGSGT